MIRVWQIPFSTNVERVSLALAYKGLEAEGIEVAPEDRSEVVRVSGQELVPVAEIEGGIVVDSAAILRRLEELRPEPPLWPGGPAERATIDLFVDWFNRVWKVAPNALTDELGKLSPDPTRAEALAAELRTALRRLEDLLAGRDYLLGSQLTAADVVAFPFLKYAAGRDPADDDPFHRVLEEYQQLDDSHPGLRAWIARIDGMPRALA